MVTFSSPGDMRKSGRTWIIIGFILLYFGIGTLLIFYGIYLLYKARKWDNSIKNVASTIVNRVYQDQDRRDMEHQRFPMKQNQQSQRQQPVYQQNNQQQGYQIAATTPTSNFLACTKCGSKNSRDSQFCNSCGNAFV